MIVCTILKSRHITNWLTKLIYTKIWHLEILENIFLITKNNKDAIHMPPLTYYFGLTFGSKNKECEEKKMHLNKRTFDNKFELILKNK